MPRRTAALRLRRSSLDCCGDSCSIEEALEVSKFVITQAPQVDLANQINVGDWLGPVDINALVAESLNLAYHGARAAKQGFNITAFLSCFLAASLMRRSEPAMSSS